MRAAGIDLGSRTVKLVVLDVGDMTRGKSEIRRQSNSRGAETTENQLRIPGQVNRILDTGTDPLARARELLAGVACDHLVATGYGRHLAREALGCPTITEIRACALGAHHLFPAVRTVIDIGGQDSKVIRVRDGNVEEFEMNDRCAAGTGRFLEVMAHALGYSLEEFGPRALEAGTAASISSMCTVFAESEVVTLLAKGESPASIALGLHKAIIARLQALLGRVGCEPDVLFAGGVARNQCVVELLQQSVGTPLRIPDAPQLVGALGAALSAAASSGAGSPLAGSTLSSP